MYTHVTLLLKYVSDPVPLHIRTNYDYRKIHIHIIRVLSAPH